MTLSDGCHVLAGWFFIFASTINNTTMANHYPKAKQRSNCYELNLYRKYKTIINKGDIQEFKKRIRSLSLGDSFHESLFLQKCLSCTKMTDLKPYLREVISFNEEWAHVRSDGYGNPLFRLICSSNEPKLYECFLENVSLSKDEMQLLYNDVLKYQKDQEDFFFRIYDVDCKIFREFTKEGNNIILKLDKKTYNIMVDLMNVYDVYLNMHKIGQDLFFNHLYFSN